MHPGGRAQAVGVPVALLPGDLVGKRLGGQEEHLLLFGEVGQRQAGVGEEPAKQQFHFLAGNQLLRGAHRIARVAVVVARDDFQLPAQHAAFGVDLFQRQLPTLLVGAQKGGNGLVAVDFADAYRRFLVLGDGNADGRQRQGQECGRKRAAQQSKAGGEHGGIAGERFQAGPGARRAAGSGQLKHALL
ncbi:hypothetical protein D3C71_1569890 [compost metagenome]